MSYDLLSVTHPRAHFDHRCIWCGQQILKGSTYTKECAVYDGEFQRGCWHQECWDLSRHINDEPEWEFTPYENERPKQVLK